MRRTWWLWFFGGVLGSLFFFNQPSAGTAQGGKMIYLPFIVAPAAKPIACLSAEEAKLAELIRQYRTLSGLTNTSLSTSLSQVAQTHVKDLYENKPNTGTDRRGLACNLHSWSNKGNWTPVCYTSDHLYASGMWSKPKEITSVYTSEGYEITYMSSGMATAEAALNMWKTSTAHNDVLLEQNGWSKWSAIGVGIYQNYAVVWFGEMADPQGTIAQCP